MDVEGGPLLLCRAQLAGPSAKRLWKCIKILEGVARVRCCGEHDVKPAVEAFVVSRFLRCARFFPLLCYVRVCRRLKKKYRKEERK